MTERKTATPRSACPACKRILPATVTEEAGALYLSTACPEHGEIKTLFKKDPAFYRDVSRIVDFQIPDDSVSPRCMTPLANAKIIGIDLTNDCNMTCPICFSAADGRPSPEMSADFILSELAKLPAKKLEVTLLGGEPTLRKDLPLIVRGIVKMGFRLKLITNGLKFEDRAFARRLRDEGLEWIIYQFDGFAPDIYLKLRGADLLERKMNILETMSDSGFKICLATMLVAGINDHQVGGLIRFAFRQPRIHHLTLLPASPLGRNAMNLAPGHLHAEDVMDLIAAQTGGRVTRRDWLDTMRMMNRIHRITGHIDYRQRVCFFSMPLLGDADDFIPAVSLVRARTLFGSLRHMPEARYVIRNLFSIDKGDMPRHLLYLSIEKMYGTAGINLEDASQCNTLYLTPEGFAPTCIYNSIYRGNSISCVSC